MPRWIRVVLGIVVVLAVLMGVAYVLRSEIATAATAFVLDRSDKARCSHPNVEVHSSLQSIVVSPIECSMSSGPMKRAQTFGPTRVELDGFGVGHAYVSRATFEFRERDVSHVETNTLGDLAGMVGASDSMIKGLLDQRDSYTRDMIPISVDRATTLRGGEKNGVMYEYRSWMDGAWRRTHAARMSSKMAGLAEIRNFDSRVTPTRARMTMGIYLGDAERGEEPDAVLRLESNNLDAERPTFEMSLDSDESSAARSTRQNDEARAARNTKAPPRD